MTLVLATIVALGVHVGMARAAAPQARVDSFLDRHWPEGASGTVLVARGGRAIVCRGIGFADRADRIPANCDTAYDVMSMTKQFTAAGILKLQMMGKLRVDETIDHFIGRVPRDKRAITISDLLDQTSGLPESLGGDYEPLSRGQMLVEAMRSRLLSAPGRFYHYSNVGYSILAVIIEKASGMGYERFLRRYLFRPAGMWHTGYVLPRWRQGQMAVEYDRHGHSKGRPFDHPWAKGGPYWNLRGNGGMLSTARDMLRWDRALLGDSVLDRSAKRELFAPRVREVPGEFYAYGWNILATPLGPLAIHNGGNDWSFGAIALSLSKRTMVFWVNNNDYEAQLYRREVPLAVGLTRAAL